VPLIEQELLTLPINHSLPPPDQIVFFQGEFDDTKGVIRIRKSKKNGLTRRVPLIEQELLTLPEHLHSPPIFSGVRVSRSLVPWPSGINIPSIIRTIWYEQERAILPYIAYKQFHIRKWTTTVVIAHHGNWLYNYLGKQCISPLMLLVRTALRHRYRISVSQMTTDMFHLS
jgi:hypothetical protein